MTALNCPIIPQAKTAVEEGFEVVACKAPADTPPLALMAQQTTPRAAMGKTTALRLKRWRILEVWINMSGRVTTKARRKPTMTWVVMSWLCFLSEVFELNKRKKTYSRNRIVNLRSSGKWRGKKEIAGDEGGHYVYI